MTIGERIKKIRRNYNLTQKEFADRIGSKRNTVATYEIGRTAPSAAVISLICREFKINQTWLEKGEGVMLEPDPNDTLGAFIRERNLTLTDRILFPKTFVGADHIRPHDNQGLPLESGGSYPPLRTSCYLK